MVERKKRRTAGDKTICLPIAAGINYEQLVQDTPAFRTYLDQQISEHPELFPQGIEQGDCFHGFVVSGRMGVTTRRIRLKQNRDSYQVRPDTVMPYMIGTRRWKRACICAAMECPMRGLPMCWGAQRCTGIGPRKRWAGRRLSAVR